MSLSSNFSSPIYLFIIMVFFKAVSLNSTLQFQSLVTLSKTVNPHQAKYITRLNVVVSASPTNTAKKKAVFFFFKGPEMSRNEI